MMKQFDDSIFSIADAVTKDINLLSNSLLSEALLAVQKVIMQAEAIKSAIANKKAPDKAGKLLLLCAELEMVNSTLTQIRHEYNL